MTKQKALDCKDCKHYKYCDKPCPPLDILANGNVARREGLARDIIGYHPDNGTNYNWVLSEMIEHKRSLQSDKLEKAQDYKAKAIIAMVEVDIPKIIIAELLSMSARQIRRIYKQYT